MNKPDPAHRSPLHYAALEGDVDQITFLLAGGADPDVSDSQGFSPLHFACQAGSIDAAGTLLEAGAKVDSENVFGNTPLFVAVLNSRGDGDLIHLLRLKEANPLHANSAGQTPVGLARLIANYDVAQYFVDLP